MSKVVYYVAASVDNFIADAEGKVDWLHEFGNNVDYGYETFYATLGAVIMGSKTYMDIFGFGVGWVYPNVESVVMTHRDLPRFPDAERLSFTQGDIGAVIADLKTRTDKDIWIVGGGDLAAQAISAGVLDEIQLAVMPVVLGRGTPLFAAFDGHRSLTLTAHTVFPDGVLMLTYTLTR